VAGRGTHCRWVGGRLPPSPLSLLSSPFCPPAPPASENPGTKAPGSGSGGETEGAAMGWARGIPRWAWREITGVARRGLLPCVPPTLRFVKTHVGAASYVANRVPRIATSHLLSVCESAHAHDAAGGRSREWFSRLVWRPGDCRARQSVPTQRGGMGALSQIWAVAIIAAKRQFEDEANPGETAGARLATVSRWIRRAPTDSASIASPA
jgi:hypothetical protein